MTRAAGIIYKLAFASFTFATSARAHADPPQGGRYDRRVPLWQLGFGIGSLQGAPDEGSSRCAAFIVSSNVALSRNVDFTVMVHGAMLCRYSPEPTYADDIFQTSAGVRYRLVLSQSASDNALSSIYVRGTAGIGYMSRAPLGVLESLTKSDLVAFVAQSDVALSWLPIGRTGACVGLEVGAQFGWYSDDAKRWGGRLLLISQMDFQ